MSKPVEFGMDTFGDVTVGADGKMLHQAEVIRKVLDEAILADEVEEARHASRPRPDWDKEVASSRFELEVARRLEGFADKLENLAWTLESAARNA